MSETTGPQAAAPAAAPEPTLPGGETADQALTRAQTAAQAKRLNESAGICDDVLATFPEHPAGLALLGIVRAMQNDHERGIALLQRAVELRPGNASWYAHLSSMCRATNRMEQALATGQRET